MLFTKEGFDFYRHWKCLLQRIVFRYTVSLPVSSIGIVIRLNPPV